MNNKNRGMILEKIINKTIDLYKESNVAIFHKKNLDITFSKTSKNLKLENAFISKKSTVDYYGIYKGIFVAFEAKSTNENYLPLNNIKDHQIEYLKLIKSHGGCAFFIILLKNHQYFYILDIENFQYVENKNLSIEFLNKYAFKLDLTFPGIIDFVPYVEKMI